MAAQSHGNGTNFDWLRKSCDISTCYLSPDGNPEKYGRSMKSAIMVCVSFICSELWPFDCLLCFYYEIHILVHPITHSLIIVSSYYLIGMCIRYRRSVPCKNECPFFSVSKLCPFDSFFHKNY